MRERQRSRRVVLSMEVTLYLNVYSMMTEHEHSQIVVDHVSSYSAFLTKQIRTPCAQITSVSGLLHITAYNIPENNTSDIQVQVIPALRISTMVA